MSPVRQKNTPSGLSTTKAALIGSILISLSILISSGTIAVKGVKAPSQPTVEGGVVGNQPSPSAAVAAVDPVSVDDHIRGDKNAQVVIVEYSDLECPFCKKYHQTLQQAVTDYQGKVAWVYRHFPLDSLHSKSRKEAEAAECAAEQGGNDAFWKLIDKIYEVTPGNNGLNLDELPQYASQIGLDATKFKSCLDSGNKAAIVEKDVQSGNKAGVKGTPASFLVDAKNNKIVPVPGAVPYDQLKSQIDALLK